MAEDIGEKKCEQIDTGSPRIIYYEPNDSFGQIDGVPVTPDYAEMCISFALSVEAVSRFKGDGGETFNKVFTLSWNSAYRDDGTVDSPSKNYVSFMEGDNSSGINTLSTFYTDTVFDEMGKKNRVVEGLGVEQVTVSFESYYVPTVTIKFVDQRGSAIFGREEFYHDNDVLTSDTVFGCFFTQPYPKFKLTVKGFFGKPVTYQLVCSQFKGNLNPQTGNFEAIVSFIGYQFGLLTDIPFNYIIAAPYCDYEGRTYWESKAESDEWMLLDGTGSHVVKLFELFANIRSALDDESLVKSLTGEADDSLTGASKQLSLLTSISSSINTLLTETMQIQGSNITDIITVLNVTQGDGKEYYTQALLVSKQDSVTLLDAQKDRINSIASKINEYNEEFGGTDGNLSYSGTILESVPSSLEMREMFVLTQGDNQKWTVKGGTVDDVIRGHEVQSGSKKVCDHLADKIATKLDSVEPDKFGGYAYLIDLSELTKKIADISTTAQGKSETTKVDTEAKYIEAAQSRLGVIPYVGNIFKILFAHLETFVHMMYHVYDVVRANPSLRSPRTLGLSLNEMDGEVGCDVDFMSTRTVPPWPAIYKNMKADQFADREVKEVIGWCGDVSHLFEEEKLVKALYSASYKINADAATRNSAVREMTWIPVNGMDVIEWKNPMHHAALVEESKLVSTLAGVLGYRISTLFGIANTKATDDYAAKCGKIDAYNFYLARPDGGSFVSVTNAERNITITPDELIDVMKCDESADKYAKTVETGETTVSHVFEHVKEIDDRKPGRHPIFIENEGNLEYVHYHTRRNFDFVPKQVSFEMQSADSGQHLLARRKYMFIDDGRYYKMRDMQAVRDVWFNAPTDAFTKDALGDDSAVFNGKGGVVSVITDRGTVEGVLRRYNDVKDGSFAVGMKTFSEDDLLADDGWLVSDYWALAGLYLYNLAFKYSEAGEDVKNKLFGIDATHPDISADADGNRTYPFNGYPGYDLDIWSSIKYPVKKDGKIVEYDVGKTETDKERSLDDAIVGTIFAWWETTDGECWYCNLFYNETYLEHWSEAERAYYFILNFYDTGGGLGGHFENVGMAFTRVIPYVLLLTWGGFFYMQDIEEQLYCPDGFQKFDPKREVPLIHKGKQVSDPEEADLFGCGYIRKNSQNYHYRTVATWNDAPEEFKESAKKEFESFFRGSTWSSIKKAFAIDPNTFVNLVNGMTKQDETQNYYLTQDGVKAFLENAPSLISGRASMVDEGGHRVPVTSTAFGKFISWAFLKDDVPVQDVFRSILTRRVLVVTSRGPAVQSGEIVVKNDIAKAYVNEFINTLQKIYGGTGEDASSENPGQSTEVDANGIIYERDIMVSIYRYLKNLWDKWLMQEQPDAYTVKNFFTPNFKFIDTLYCDIKRRFMMNCQILSDVYDNVSQHDDISLFKYIGDITTKHHCMFIGLPDFITFKTGTGDDTEQANLEMRELFTPIPYHKMPPPREQNFFVIIYTPGLSTTPSGKFNGFPDETLNIWSRNGVNSNLPNSFKKSNFLSEEKTSDRTRYTWKEFDPAREIDRYGYNVPAFGVAFGRQNNHLFKNIKLNMETPVITSASINTLSHIAMRGAWNDHVLAFVGQDIYPVFSNYSYIAEVEMMGDAQIQPLMYFQLMNVPMWRGTYMIFNVTHNMTPGQMTTTFKGMKLSKTKVNYTNAWFTKRVNFQRRCPEEDQAGTAATVSNAGGAGHLVVNSKGLYDPSSIRNETMRKLFVDTNDGYAFLDHYYYPNEYKVRHLDRLNYDVPGNTSNNKVCMGAVRLWYKKAIGERYWTPGWGHGHSDPTGVNFASLSREWEQAGLECRWKGSVQEIENVPKSTWRPGDIGIMFSTQGGMGHAQMWVGNHWRSDEVYKPNGEFYVYRDNGRGEYPASVWYWPDLQEPPESADVTTTTTTTPNVNPTVEEKRRKRYNVLITFSTGHNGPDPLLKVFDGEGHEVASYNACVAYKTGKRTTEGDARTPVGTGKITEIQDSSRWTHDYTRDIRRWCNPQQSTNSKAFGKYACRLSRDLGINNSILIHGTAPERGPHATGTCWPYDTNGCIRIVEIEDFVNRFAYAGMEVQIKDTDHR